VVLTQTTSLLSHLKPLLYVMLCDVMLRLPRFTRLQHSTVAKINAPPLHNLCDHIRPPISASSLRPLRFSQPHDIFIPRLRTTMAHTRSFASIGRSLWVRLPPPFALLFSLLPFHRLSIPLKVLPFSWKCIYTYINAYIHIYIYCILVVAF